MILVKWFRSSDRFVSLIIRECGLAHKTIIFVLDEFDLFALVRPHHPVPTCFFIAEALQFDIHFCIFGRFI